LKEDSFQPCFNLKKLLMNLFDDFEELALLKTMPRDWHRRFKSGDFGTSVKEGPS
jgi:hypothetical protein